LTRREKKNDARRLVACLATWVALMPTVWAESPLPETDALARVATEPVPVQAFEHAEDESLLLEAAIEEVHRQPRFSARAEYLYWWTKSGQSPSLLTTGSSKDARPGALGSPNTRVLYGGEIDFDDRHGGRFSLGWTLDETNLLGIEAGYFFLGSRTVGIEMNSPGSPVLARPFFDEVNQRQDSSLIAFPGLVQGSASVAARNELDGAEANLSANLWQTHRLRLDLLVGFRYLSLTEDLHITEVSKVVGKGPFTGRTITLSDRFDADNSFYGGQIGLRSDWRWKRLHLGLLAKVALGSSHEVIEIHGRTAIDTAPATVTSAGLLALSSNGGRYARDHFAVVPELGINLAVQITDRLQAFIGYTYLYWSQVARPGDQADPHLNPGLVPTSTTFNVPGGPSRPAFSFRDADFWAQGINIGMEFRY
jgi:hypothetical protein